MVPACRRKDDIYLMVSFSIGMGAGSSILIGQAYGARNRERMKRNVAYQG